MDRRKAILGIMAFGFCATASAGEKVTNPAKKTYDKKQKKYKNLFEQQGLLPQKVDVIAEYLGLKDPE